LSPESKAFILGFCKSPEERRQRSGFAGVPSVLNLLFGAAPKVGDAVTLQDVFNKTAKGKDSMTIFLRRWAEKGIIVKYVQDPANVFTSRYVIEKLPTA
jgi:hypothetical protein